MRNFITKKTYKNPMKQNLNQLRKCLLTCVAFFVTFLSTQESFAKVAEKNLLQQYAAELEEVEAYLNNLKNLTAKFVQETSDGNNAEGKLYLSRPGKMRVEYDGQQKILIIVNGSVLSYTDLELDETSYLGTNTTPASFLTRANISFSAKDVEITAIKKSEHQIKISVMKKNRKEAGEFSVIFATNPLKFIKMEVKNDLDQITSITLKDPDFSSSIANSLFVIKNKNLPN